MPSVPSVSKGNVFADRVQRYKRTSKPTQRQYASAPSFGQKIVKPTAGQGKGPVNAPVGQAAPAVPQTPYVPPAVAPPASAPAYSQDNTFTPYAPTAPPGQAPPPAGSIPASVYATHGAGAFPIDPAAPGSGMSAEAVALAQASMQTPERIAQDARTRENSEFAPDGRPWWMVDQDLAAKAANPPGPDWGYMNNNVWTPLTTYGGGQGAVAGAPAGGYNTPQAQHQAMIQMWGSQLSPDQLLLAQMQQLWGPQGTGW